jgi:hypothetical protein
MLFSEPDSVVEPFYFILDRVVSLFELDALLANTLICSGTMRHGTILPVAFQSGY